MDHGHGPSQDVPFFYKPYYLSELQSFKEIPTNIFVIFKFKLWTTFPGIELCCEQFLNFFTVPEKINLIFFAMGFFAFLNHAYFHIYFSW